VAETQSTPASAIWPMGVAASGCSCGTTHPSGYPSSSTSGTILPPYYVRG